MKRRCDPVLVFVQHLVEMSAHLHFQRQLLDLNQNGTQINQKSIFCMCMTNVNVALFKVKELSFEHGINFDIFIR